MLLRIFLIVSILAGAGIGAITHFMVKPHVEAIIKVRDDYISSSNKLAGVVKNTSNTLVQTEKTLNSTKAKLTDTQSQLASTTKKLGEERDRGIELKAELDTTKNDLGDARRELHAWKMLELSPDQIKGVIADNKKLKGATEALEEEKLVMQKVIDKLNVQLRTFVNQTEEVEAVLPSGLKGNVLVVDPKWDFVVLNIGEKQNVMPHGVMMVSRDGKLIAKIKVVSVQADRCIANIMPQWKLGDVMEGDLVLSKN
jgi:hypothetical protein